MEEVSQRKRPRLDSEDPTEPKVEVGPLVKDELYYREDGDCVIQVKNVLFKVHRFLLERDMSAFSNMFSMPQSLQPPAQALTDDNPLVLHDDVEEFRALCWIIYALPTVYQNQNVSHTADIDKLVSLVMIVHKYHFEAHEKWVRSLLQKHCRAVHAPPVTDFFIKCQQERIGKLMRISSSPDTYSFQDSVRIAWLHRLEKKPEESITDALRVAEELGDRKFQADIYYKELMRMTALLAPNSTAYTMPTNDLAPHQRVALYQGYWSLQNYWRNTVITSLRRRFSCPPGHACSHEWKRVWREYRTKMLDLKFDPHNTLQEMSATFEMLELDNGVSTDCTVDSIEELLNKLQHTLDDHFLGPVLPSLDN